jgi:hypothetical protein
LSSGVKHLKTPFFRVWKLWVEEIQ